MGTAPLLPNVCQIWAVTLMTVQYCKNISAFTHQYLQATEPRYVLSWEGLGAVADFSTDLWNFRQEICLDRALNFFAPIARVVQLTRNK